MSNPPRDRVSPPKYKKEEEETRDQVLLRSDLLGVRALSRTVPVYVTFLGQTQIVGSSVGPGCPHPEDPEEDRPKNDLLKFSGSF